MKNIVYLAALFSTQITYAQSYKIAGRITNEKNIPLQNVTIESGNHKTISNQQGYYDLILPKGKHSIKFQHLGYKPIVKEVNINNIQQLNVSFNAGLINIDEVYVTAQESKSLNTSSIINKEAMQLLQPSSFADLLELLPGGRAQDPNLTSFNAIKLREVNLKGKTMTSEKYDMSSLGISFYMDGAPINTNSDIQSVAGYTTSTLNGNVENTNKGLDLRSLGTDDIEKVTIVRGIPSVEYGDLTSGLVLIDRKKGYSPYTLRAKTDGFGKLISIGKGYTLKDSLLINADFGYINAQSDPTNTFVNFRRLSGSLRFDKTWKKNNTYILRSNIDYATTLDNNKNDPDNSYVADSYYGRKQKYDLNNQFITKFKNNNWIEELQLISKFTFQKDIIDEDKWIQARTATILINSLEQGSHEAQFLTPSYMSNLYVEGLPFTAYHKITTTHQFGNRTFRNRFKLGLESNFSKNFGAGQVYDLNYPTNTSITARPRAFKDIPSYHTLSAFAEDNIKWNIDKFTLEAAPGIRAFAMTSLSNQYTMSNKIYVEPRANVRLHLPKINIDNKPLQFIVGGGAGIHKKTPTLDHLYPNLQYRDIVELNFYHNNPDYRIAQAYTNIINPVNYDIKPATNNKFELNTDISYDGNTISLTFFKESMKDAFRPNSLTSEINYTYYNNTSIDLSNISKKPAPSDFTSTQRSELYNFSQTQNGSQTLKDGLEFRVTTRRFKGINTRLDLNGALYNTTYKNSLPIWKLDTDIIHNGKTRQIEGLYADDDGYKRQILNTNLTADSYLPTLGLNLSASFQALWYYKSTRMPKSGIPIAYRFVDDMIERPFTLESLSDPTLKQLVETYSPTLFYTSKEPLDLQVNVKASKSFKNYLKASVFVNRLFLYRPNYTTTSGATVSRSLESPYFGMELTFTL